MSIKIKQEWVGVVLRIAAHVVIMSVVENICANQTSNLVIQVWRAISAILILAAIFFGMVQAKNFEQLGLVGENADDNIERLLIATYTLGNNYQKGP